MTEQIPPLENNENFEDYNLDSGREKIVPSQEVIKELENEDLESKFKQSELADSIRTIQSKKETGAELWNAKPTTSYNITPKQKPSNKFRNGLMAFRLGLAGLLGLGATKEAKAGGPIDSTNKKPNIEKVSSDNMAKEGLKIRELTGTERQDWNNFIDFVKEKGLAGSEKLDKGNDALARSLFDEYRELHPKTTLSYDIVPSVQYEMQKMKETTQDFAKRHNDPNAQNIMSFVSKVDGWFGSHTSRSKFPFMVMDQYHNDALVSSKNLGLVNSKLQTEQMAQVMKKVPKGAKLEELDGGIFYQDESSGDLIKVADK